MLPPLLCLDDGLVPVDDVLYIVDTLEKRHKNRCVDNDQFLNFESSVILIFFGNTYTQGVEFAEILTRSPRILRRTLYFRQFQSIKRAKSFEMKGKYN